MEKIYTFTFNGIQIQFVANSIVNAMAFANEYFIPHTGPTYKKLLLLGQ
jgi:hypothetical protein